MKILRPISVFAMALIWTASAVAQISLTPPAAEAPKPAAKPKTKPHTIAKKPAETAAVTRSPFDRAFQLRLPAVSQETPKSPRTDKRCESSLISSRLASSSHMERIGDLGCDLHDLA